MQLYYHEYLFIVLSALTFDSSGREDIVFPQDNNLSLEGLLRIPARLLVNSTGNSKLQKNNITKIVLLYPL